MNYRLRSEGSSMVRMPHGSFNLCSSALQLASNERLQIKIDLVKFLTIHFQGWL